MNNKEKPKEYSRRGFIKGISSGVVGSYMVVPVLSKISKKVFEEVEMEGTNKEPLTLNINGKKVSVLLGSLYCKTRRPDEKN
jgi:ribosomal protein L25 (general stress protein Ctc)